MFYYSTTINVCGNFKFVYKLVYCKKTSEEKRGRSLVKQEPEGSSLGRNDKKLILRDCM